jgi:hypothetical protein
MYYTNVYKIFKKSIAIKLRKKGFKVIKTEPNYKKPEFDVYFFEDTSEFRKVLNEIAND